VSQNTGDLDHALADYEAALQMNITDAKAQIDTIFFKLIDLCSEMNLAGNAISKRALVANKKLPGYYFLDSPRFCEFHIMATRYETPAYPGKFTILSPDEIKKIDKRAAINRAK
jgi:hypothetical protein